MIVENFTFKSSDNREIFVYKWTPEEVTAKGIVQIAHGMAEHAERYDRFARFLCKEGFIVYANDHRGHGKSAGSIDGLGYLADEDGFDLLVQDMKTLSSIIKNDNPYLPLFLFGHSMGSFAAQRYLMLEGIDLKGLILSGSNGKQGIMLKMGAYFAKREIKKHGRRFISERLDRLIFSSYNKNFQPSRTSFDWLSRDDREVDKYIKDPYCGTIFTAGFFYDFLGGLIEIEDKRNLPLIARDIPIYILSGDMDPVGKFGKGVMNLYKAYKDLGVEDVKYKLYPGGRHEILNETNREEVMDDILEWLNLHI